MIEFSNSLDEEDIRRFVEWSVRRDTGLCWKHAELRALLAFDRPK